MPFDGEAAEIGQCGCLENTKDVQKTFAHKLFLALVAGCCLWKPEECLGC